MQTLVRMVVLSLGFMSSVMAASPIASAAPAFSQDNSILALPAFPTDRFPGSLTSPRRSLAANPGVTTPLVEPPAAPAPQTKDKVAPSRAETMDELFHRLSAAADGGEASGIATTIEHLWLQSGSDTADLLMARAVSAIGKGDMDVASTLLAKIVALDPDWAEAWNKRATLRFLNGDDVGSMGDISHVLSLESRHFGALSGMGFILQRNGMKKDALSLFRKAAAIYPHNAELEKAIDSLSLEVDGRPI